MTSNTDNPTIVETILHPATTDCGIEYNIIENTYPDGSKTIINCPYIPEPMRHACIPVDYYAVLSKLIVENSDKWEQITSPDDPRIGWFVGQTMKETGGKASPATINQYLKDWKQNEGDTDNIGC